MTSFDDLLSQVPVAQIADKLGVDQATANTAISAAIPVLLGGFQAQAGNPDAAAHLEGEIAKQPEDLLEGGVNIDQVDTTAGNQVVEQTFGAEKNTVMSALGNVGGSAITQDLMSKLLPMLAPIVLAYVGKKMLGGAGAGGGAATGAQAGGGGIGDILGSLLGGATGGGQGGSGGLGDILGKAVGQNAGSVLGNVLGGLLGGKK
ncbi:DUF937 domain-containing protein [Nocardia yamanashiensis]|uniref:DUF937 domain-containing protein n=1 Tax=Nocardia yamanashiensis TaxID=209247 RepID=UPI001E51F735|nr:DUF937 domain-containing protein [Nocardia yamanashiensis]UGT39898.1 DUF937 domain-containing protein [Nocardia yamanashiensis]